MGLIDNFVALVSPEAAYKREAYRQAYEELKNYDAGAKGGANSNWRAVNESAEITDRYDRDDVRARARDLERNSDVMNSLISAYKRNVIGGGYHVQAKTEDADLNNMIEKAWKRWCKKRNCDVTEQQSFNEMIRMAVVRKRVDGGILFYKTFSKDGFVPFKLQLFEVDELDTDVMDAGVRGNKVIGGVEVNSYNKPVAYWIKQYDPDGINMTKPIRIEAKNIIYYYSKKRPSQIREMSEMAPAVPRVRDVNEFITATSVKQRVEACLSIFIKKQVPTNSVGRSGAPVERVSYDGKLLMPGMIRELNAGDEIQTVNPAGQAADATSFTKMLQRLIGAGQGISYESFSRDMSESNYSSARAGLIEDELTYQEEKELLVEILDEIYETFVISAVLCGALNIPNFWEEKERYLNHEWIQEPKPWIDPMKEANANKTALATGQKTFMQIAAENGRDWRDQVDDMAAVVEYGREKGLDMGGILYGLHECSADAEGTESEE